MTQNQHFKAMSKLIVVLLTTLCLLGAKPNLPDSRRAKDVREKVWPKLENELNAKGFKPGSPIYIRIFKEEDDLEIWIKKGGRYAFFKSFNICFFLFS